MGAKPMKHFGEPIKEKNEVARCNGGGGPLGHPAVFLNLSPREEIVCPYCSRYFVKDNNEKSHKKRRK